MGDSSTVRDPRTLRWRDRFILRFVRFSVFYLYETVEVYVPDMEWSDDERVLAVSNHFGGFADPFLLMSAFPVVPRIIARDKIWKVPVARQIMNWIGAIPVHKPKEQRGPTSNKEMFQSCYTALADGDVLLIFPEGITREDPSIAPVKTGAARIALGAREEGTSGIKIVPIGIHYEDKAALRSKVFINAGLPIDLDAEIDTLAPDGDATPENREAVTNLTAEIETYLRDVAPDFEDWHEARTLTIAAEATLRVEAEDPSADVSISQRDRLAADLAGAEPDAKAAVMDASQALRTDLEGVGLSDAEVYAKMRTGSLLWFLIRTILVLIVAVPLALIGLSVNLIPMLLVWAINLVPVDPAVKATAKPAGAILFFGISWGVALWQAFEQDLVYGLLALVLLPVSLGALIYSTERLVQMWRALRRWTRNRRIDTVEDEITCKREAVRASVRGAVPRDDE